MGELKQLSYDVCIVGGGIVGLTLAALLGQSKLSVAIIEPGAIPDNPAASEASDYALRVSAINLASMRIFRHLGIEQAILEQRASPYEKMQIWDANSAASIDFDAEDIDHDALGYILENDLIVHQLHETIQNRHNITYLADTFRALEFTDHAVVVKAGHHQLNAALVIGADGQHSRVRSLAQLATEFGRFNQTALVCRIQTERPHQLTAYQCFHHSGPIAYLPLADGSSSIVWSSDEHKAEELKQLDDQAFARAVEAAMQSRLGAVTIAGPRGAFELAQQHAQSYVQPRLALVGDAAHRTHPLAGLGANLGLQDAAVLAETIQDALASHQTFHSLASLRKYERRRKHHNAMVLNAMQAFKSGFASSSPVLTAMRALALNSADSLRPIKSLISQQATGDQGDLPRICQPDYQLND